MTPAEVEKFITLLGGSKGSWRGGRYHASCPLARWTHQNGMDSNPSFAVWRTPKGGLRFKCLACGHRGNLRGLLWKHMKFSKGWIPEAMHMVYPLEIYEAPEEDLEYRIGGSSVGDAHARPVEPLTPYVPGSAAMPTGKTESLWEGMAPSGDVDGYKPPDEWKIEQFKAELPPVYVRDRGISKDAYRVWELGHDRYRRRVVFPCRNLEDELVGYTSRLYWESNHCFRCGKSIIDKEKTEKKREVDPQAGPVLIYKCTCKATYSKYWHWPGPWRRNNVYGIDKWEGGPIVVVEGTTDVIRLWDLGVRSPMCIFGAHPNEEQVKMICELGGIVYVLGDGDKAGRQMNAEFSRLARPMGFGVQELELPILEKKIDPGNAPLEVLREILPPHLFTA